MKIVDLSVSIVDGMPVDPGPQIAQIEYRDHRSPASIKGFLTNFPGLKEEDIPDGESWAVEIIKVGTHAGTHMDAPWHFFPTMNNGEPSWTIDQIPLEWCMGNGVVVDASDKPDGYVMTSKDFEEYFDRINYKLKPGDIVLLHTNAMQYWGTKEFMNRGCGVGREGTLWLCQQGVHTVGTDAYSWDPPLPIVAARFAEEKDTSIIWEGHRAGKECAYLQMEKLCNLDKLPATGFQFIALPVKIQGASAGWTRAIAILDEA